MLRKDYVPTHLLLSLMLSSCLVAPNALAQDNDPSLNDFGMTGLLQMPSARLASGDAAWFSLVHSNPYRHWSLGAKFTPWLEVSFRQTESLTGPVCVSACFDDYWRKAFALSSGMQVGRSIDVKILLKRETAYLPAVSLGFQDMFGSGEFRGEYIVASKRRGPLDLTFGLGWGYLGSSADVTNPARVFGDKFDLRSQETPGQKQEAHKDWFSGQAIGFFGGVEYHTAVNGLSFKAEWSSIDPSTNFEPIKRKRSFPIGVGLNYKPKSWLSSGLAFEDGNRVMFRLSLSADLTKSLQPKPKYSSEAVARSVRENAVVQGQSPDQKLFKTLSQQGYVIVASDIGAQRAYVSVTGPDDLSVLEMAQMVFTALGGGLKRVELAVNGREAYVITPGMLGKSPQREAVYEDLDAPKEKQAKHVDIQAELPRYSHVVDVAIHKAISIEPSLGSDVELIDVSVRNRSIELAKISFVRAHVIKFNKGILTGKELQQSSRIEAGPHGVKADYGDTKLRWAVGPHIEEQLGGDSIAKADLFARAKASVSFGGGFEIDAGIRQRIAGNLDTLDSPVVSSTFPIVRSDLIDYLDRNSPMVDRMAISYTKPMGEKLFVRAQAGIMESQFSAVGAELLYMPPDSEWAVGGELYYAKKRRAGTVFDSDDYDIATGHISLYREIPQYAATAKLSAGRYLGGDWGMTFDLSREFDSGIKLGLYTTLTDAPNFDASESNFVKGAYLTIPLNLFWGNERGEPFGFDFRKLLQNAGQKLNTGRSFYDELQSGRRWRIHQTWPK